MRSRGIPLKPDEEDAPISKYKLVTYWEELEVHRDRAVFLWYDLWFVEFVETCRGHEKIKIINQEAFPFLSPDKHVGR